jgi:hypothetical protein
VSANSSLALVLAWWLGFSSEACEPPEAPPAAPTLPATPAPPPAEVSSALQLQPSEVDSRCLQGDARACATSGIGYQLGTHVRQRFAEQAGAVSRGTRSELAERASRLARSEERIRGIIVMQAEGDRSPMVAQMRRDLEAQAADERSAIADLRDQASAPIRLPPVDLLTERVFALRALVESEDVQSARAALQRYFKGSIIAMTPEPHGDGQAYVARGDFMPLALLADQAETPSELSLGGRCPRVVARGRYSTWTTAFTVPIEVRVA